MTNLHLKSLTNYELAKLLKDDELVTINMINEAAKRLVLLQDRVNHFESLYSHEAIPCEECGVDTNNWSPQHKIDCSNIPY